METTIPRPTVTPAQPSPNQIPLSSMYSGAKSKSMSRPEASSAETEFNRSGSYRRAICRRLFEEAAPIAKRRSERFPGSAARRRIRASRR